MQPPLALPDVEEPPPAPATDDFEYRDKVYEIDAFCNLECGAEGECLMERTGEEDGTTVRKRCLCPHGKFGERCSNDKFISAPEFSGHSYIALPTLTNAYSDLQLSMEFRHGSCSYITLLPTSNKRFGRTEI